LPQRDVFSSFSLSLVLFSFKESSLSPKRSYQIVVSHVMLFLPQIAAVGFPSPFIAFPMPPPRRSAPFRRPWVVHSDCPAKSLWPFFPLRPPLEVPLSLKFSPSLFQGSSQVFEETKRPFSAPGPPCARFPFSFSIPHLS